MNKININNQNITSSDIDKYKDFQKLKAKYNTMPKRFSLRNKWNLMGMAVILLIAILSAWYIVSETKNLSFADKSSNFQSFINPPMPQCDIPYLTIKYSGLNDTIIKLASGSSIVILKNSMVDSSGNMPNEPIILKYREFMNPAEIFLSGIPMVYDTNYIQYTFESAGMIELKALCDGKPLQIKPDKPIRIYFYSAMTSKDYNLYYLDTLQRNWVYKGKDSVVYSFKDEADEISIKPLPIIIEESVDEEDFIWQPGSQAPEKPVLANPKKWHFNLDIIESEFPELKEYKKTVFEIDESFKPLNPNDSKIEWEDITIEKASKPLHYFVTFKAGSKECRYLTVPVLTGESYNVALKNYEIKYKNYQDLLEQRKIAEKANLALIAKIRESNQRDSLFSENLKSTQQTKEKVIRSFEIMNFGIWNCDRIYKYALNEIQSNIKVNDTTVYNNVYLADIPRKALFTYYSGNLIRYDKTSRNILWTVVDKNHIAVFTAEDFKKIPVGIEKYTFNLKRLEKTIESSKDFIELYSNGFSEPLK